MNEKQEDDRPAACDGFCDSSRGLTQNTDHVSTSNLGITLKIRDGCQQQQILKKGSTTPAGKHRGSTPVEESAGGLAVEKGHGEAHHFGQQVCMQSAGCIEGAQDQQQGPAPLDPQRHQAQGEVEGHVAAAVQVQALLFQPGGFV